MKRVVAVGSISVQPTVAQLQAVRDPKLTVPGLAPPPGKQPRGLVECRECRIPKDPVEDFYWKKGSTKYRQTSVDTRDLVCKRCRNDAKKRRRREQPRPTDDPEYRLWFAEYQRQRYHSNLEASRAFSRGRMQVRKRGATSEDLEWQEILRFDPCSYCGQYSDRTMQIEHVVPVDDGGEPNDLNVVAACQPCNSSKGTKSLLEFLLCRL